MVANIDILISNSHRQFYHSQYSQPRSPPPKSKDIPNVFDRPHSPPFADLLFTQTAQGAQRVIVSVVSQKSAVVSNKSADDVAAQRCVVSGVLDGVGLSFRGELVRRHIAGLKELTSMIAAP